MIAIVGVLRAFDATRSRDALSLLVSRIPEVSWAAHLHPAYCFGIVCGDTTRSKNTATGIGLPIVRERSIFVARI